MKTPTAHRNELGYTFNEVFTHIAKQLESDKRKIYGQFSHSRRNKKQTSNSLNIAYVQGRNN